MDNVKYLICGDVKNPQRKFGDAGVDCFVPNYSEKFVEDVKNCNPHNVNLGKIVIREDTIRIAPQADIKFPLYIKSRIPAEIVLKVTNKSGVATKQKFAVGADTIDSAYSGIHHAHIYNFSDEWQSIAYGQKIIQEVPFVIEPNDITVVSDMSEEEFYKDFETHRGAGGFGSTGLN